jgi:uncharacterized damage-inducible protein DinB
MRAPPQSPKPTQDGQLDLGPTPISGERGTMTRGAILLHVVNHATYHRGWVAEMFFQLPARNPTIDLPVYLSNLAAA